MEGHPEVHIDLDAITANAAALVAHVGGARLMAVVKSDGYGHGLLPTATAALAGGASWLGVVRLTDALALRAAGVTVPVLCLIGARDVAHGEAIGADIDLTVGSATLVRQIAAAARRAGRPARLHLEADTGMCRGGATAADWPGVVREARAAEAAGHARIVGIWSHFACADIPGHPSIAAQLAGFRAAVELAEQAGARPEVRHMANTPATLTLPESWFDLVRPGGAIVGLSTLPGGAPGWLRPAMTVRARLVETRRVPAGSGVSYGHRYVTSGPATLGVFPLGYNEGVPRLASNTAQVSVRGHRFTIAGTVNMNQTIIDFGDLPAEPGDEVIVFGPGDAGEPTAQEWADALGTISYEIVTRFTGKIPRSYSEVTSGQDRAQQDRAQAVDGRTNGQVAAAY
ncbi:MAG TPA: alanine racemase [Streptosporangiaceae bacterium]|nr:alanine racemase [Streptosporangiaceae bacterium]